MSKPDSIILGGKDFPIAPLTLGQLKQAGPAVTRIGLDTPEGVSAQTTLLYLAMHNADSKITPADVDAIPGVTFPELKIAVEKVAKILGVESKEAVPGEAEPVAPATASPTSTGQKSTAA